MMNRRSFGFHLTVRGLKQRIRRFAPDAPCPFLLVYLMACTVVLAWAAVLILIP